MSFLVLFSIFFDFDPLFINRGVSNYHRGVVYRNIIMIFTMLIMFLGSTIIYKKNMFICVYILGIVINRIKKEMNVIENGMKEIPSLVLEISMLSFYSMSVSSSIKLLLSYLPVSHLICRHYFLSPFV